MESYLPQLLLAWSIQIVGIATPGPGVALILSVATRRGRLPAFTTAFGFSLASIVLSLATVVGLAAVFAQMAELMTVVRLVGAGYLLWLAYKSFMRAAHPADLVVATPVEGRLWSLGVTAFLLQLSNPKAILFWLAIASVGGVGNAPLPIVALFVFGAFVNSFLGHLAWAFLLSSGPFRQLYLRARRGVEAALGGFFAFAAYKLATTEA